MSGKTFLAPTDKVKGILQQLPAARDNDQILVANVWQGELRAQRIDLNSISGREVLSMIASGKVSPVESITRCRRKLQEEWPQLRGKRWEERHMKQTVVQTELGY